MTRIEMKECPTELRVLSGDPPGVVLGGMSHAAWRELFSAYLSKRDLEDIDWFPKDAESKPVTLSAETKVRVKSSFWNPGTPLAVLTRTIVSGAQVLKRHRTPWFLDLSSKDAALQPPPEIATVGDHKVTLANLVAWKAPGEAVVELSDGLYSLARR